MWLMVTTYPAPPTSRYGPVKVMRPGLATACWYLHSTSHRLLSHSGFIQPIVIENKKEISCAFYFLWGTQRVPDAVSFLDLFKNKRSSSILMPFLSIQNCLGKAVVYLLLHLKSLMRRS